MTIFLTFYTDENYKKLAKRLGHSCARFGLKFEAIKGQELGTWRANCNQKAQILLDFWAGVTEPVCFLDADCVIHKEPALLLGPHHNLPDAILWAGGQGRRYVSSGVTWWNKTPGAFELIRKWAECCVERRGRLADPALRRAVGLLEGKVKVRKLPPEYLKPYWKRKSGVAPADIVISCNERGTEKRDGLYDRKRRRVDPLTEAHSM